MAFWPRASWCLTAAIRIDNNEDPEVRDSRVLYAVGRIGEGIDLAEDVRDRLKVAYASAKPHRQTVALELDPTERHEARFLFRHYFLFCLVGLLSVLTAWPGIGLRFGFPGWIYG